MFYVTAQLIFGTELLHTASLPFYLRDENTPQTRFEHFTCRLQRQVQPPSESDFVTRNFGPSSLKTELDQ